MSKLIKDPLVHFLLIGAALFAIAALRGTPETRDRIVVTAEQVDQARAAATALQGRAPTSEELAELVEPLVRDEIMYRAARALGLDDNDDEVRRRLIEKMSYLTQDTADPAPQFRGPMRTRHEEVNHEHSPLLGEELEYFAGRTSRVENISAKLRHLRLQRPLAHQRHTYQ